jgi:lysophospholipid acyltransferase (LPLAT)-like uncharacterized protein
MMHSGDGGAEQNFETPDSSRGGASGAIGVDATPTIESDCAATRNPDSLRRRVKRARRALGRKIAGWFGPTVLRLLASTWRITKLGEEHLDGAREGGEGRIIALWHGRILLPLAHHARHNWFILVSRSGDGDITSTILERFGYRTIRGSSSRGGAHALRGMVKALQAGSVLVITPDGPRGPRHSVDPGLVWIARTTGYAVLPCGAVCDRAWRLNSWDRFTIPKPGARVVFVYGAPVNVESSRTPEDMIAAGEKLRELILESERRGLAYLSLEPDW